MNNTHKVYIILIVLLLFTACAPQRYILARGPLKFKSGFEGTTHITGEISTTSSKNGWIEGLDGPLGDWSSLKGGNYNNLDWVVSAAGWFQGGRLEIAQDPTGADNQVLRLRNTHGGRSQWELRQAIFWADDGTPNKFDQQFYTYRMYIPSDITTVPAFNKWSEWYMIWESHQWADFPEGDKIRHGIYLRKRPDSNHWYFSVQQSMPAGCNGYDGPPYDGACEIYWDNKGAGQEIAVPFDQWFTFDVFFKYHETDGEWFVAVTREGQERETVAHFTGKTKNNEKLHDQTLFKMYANGVYLDALGEYSQYYDDLEIWSDYPPGYFDTPVTPTPTGMPPINDCDIVINAGDTIVTQANKTTCLRGGTYVQKVYISEDNVILTAYPGENPVIDGQGTLAGGWGVLLWLVGDHIEVSGIEVKNSAGMCVKLEGNYINVSEMKVHHCEENGILITGDYGIVENSEVYQAALGRTAGWASALSAARSPHGAIIRNNYVHDNMGEGVSTYEATGTLIEGNEIRDSWSGNLYISDATDVIAQNNIVYDTGVLSSGGRGGIGMGDEKCSPCSARNTIINNHISHTRLNFYWWANPGISNKMVDTVISGNTFEESIYNAGVQINAGDHVNTVFENNTIIQTNGLPPFLNYGNVPGENTIITDVSIQTATFTVAPPTVTMSATSTPVYTNTPTPTSTSTSVPTYTPTATPTSTATATPTPKPDLCVMVAWDKGLNLRPGATMYNIAQGYMSQGMEFEPLSIVENTEGSFAEFGHGWFVAMKLNTNPNNIYAVECPK